MMVPEGAYNSSEKNIKQDEKKQQDHSGGKISLYGT
jgi:hypothetical protein